MRSVHQPRGFKYEARKGTKEETTPSLYPTSDGLIKNLRGENNIGRLSVMPRSVSFLPILGREHRVPVPTVSLFLLFSFFFFLFLFFLARFDSRRRHINRTGSRSSFIVETSHEHRSSYRRKGKKSSYAITNNFARWNEKVKI